MSELPQSFYYIVGFLLVTNLGMLGSFVVVVFKAGMLISEFKHNNKDAKDTAVRAHRRIDKLEGATINEESEG